MPPFQESRVALGVPVGTEMVHWRFMASLVEMEKTPIYGLIIRQGSLVDSNRNEVVKLMLEHPAKFTHLLFIDSDMTFPQNTMRQLLSHDKPVAGGLCYQRKPPFAPVIFKRTPSGEGNRGLYSLTPFDLTQNNSPLVRVDACGTGCLLVKREVFESIPPPWFAIEWVGNTQRGEDLYFADACHQRQIPFHVDTTLLIGHMGAAGVQQGRDLNTADIKFLS